MKISRKSLQLTLRAPAASQPARGRATAARAGPARGPPVCVPAVSAGRTLSAAVYRDRNIVLIDVANGDKETPITADGSTAGRIKNAARQAGSTAKNSIRRRPCGGRPTARCSPITALTKPACRTISCSLGRQRCTAALMSRRILFPANPIRRRNCSSTASPIIARCKSMPAMAKTSATQSVTTFITSRGRLTQSRSVFCGPIACRITWNSSPPIRKTATAG